MGTLQRELHTSQETVRALTEQNTQLRHMIVQKGETEWFYIYICAATATAANVLSVIWLSSDLLVQSLSQNMSLPN